jgi:four helix bundle protein
MQNEKVRSVELAKKSPRDIEARTFALAVRIIRLTQSMIERPGVNRTIGQQLLRAGTSIGANVEEAQAGQSRADFLCKMCIALKEARETRYWIRLLIAADMVKAELLTNIADEVDQLTNILGAIVRSTRRRAKGAVS